MFLALADVSAGGRVVDDRELRVRELLRRPCPIASAMRKPTRDHEVVLLLGEVLQVRDVVGRCFDSRTRDRRAELGLRPLEPLVGEVVEALSFRPPMSVTSPTLMPDPSRSRPPQSSHPRTRPCWPPPSSPARRGLGLAGSDAASELAGSDAAAEVASAAAVVAAALLLSPSSSPPHAAASIATIASRATSNENGRLVLMVSSFSSTWAAAPAFRDPGSEENSATADGGDGDAHPSAESAR